MLSLAFWPQIWSIFVNVPYILAKTVYAVIFWCILTKQCFYFVNGAVQIIYSLTNFLDVCFINYLKDVLHAASLIVDLYIPHFKPVSFALPIVKLY